MIGVLHLFLPRSFDASSGRSRSVPPQPSAERARDRIAGESGTFGRIHLEDEASLIERLRGGDTDAFERIFLAYYPSLVRYCQAMLREEAAASDVAQDVLMRLWLSRASTQTRSLGAYLFGAVRHGAIDHMRRGARERVRVSDWTADTFGDRDERTVPDIDAADTWPPSMALVEQVIRRLAPRCQEIFRLKWEHGLRYGEIAALLGVSVKTVDAQLVIATRALRGAFKRPDL